MDNLYIARLSRDDIERLSIRNRVEFTRIAPFE